jgi:hypothetical protein
VTTKQKKPAKKPPAKSKAKPKANAKAKAQPEVASELGPRAERGGAAIVCSQCDATIDSGMLRIVLEAGEALHPS